jgi:anti-sigma B factor antagonist/stage II sporulation protein AA (anti-sigma F factor antagonist)
MNLASVSYADATVLTPDMPRIDHANAEEFKTALKPHLDRCTAHGPRLVLDFSRVEYISSVGLRVLMLAARQVKAQGGSVVLAALQDVVREIFTISRFNLVIECFPEVCDALAGKSSAALAAAGGK